MQIDITFKDLGLENNTSSSQYRKYLDILNKFVKKNNSKNITHIFIGGSFTLGNLNKNSDIDVYVVKTSIGNQITQKKTIINEVEVECFCLGKEFIKNKLKIEQKNPHRLYSHCFAKWKKIKGDNSLDRYIKLAKNITKSTIPVMKKIEKISSIDLLVNFKQEIKTFLDNNDIISFHLKSGQLIYFCVEKYFHINRIEKPEWKYLSASIQNKKFKQLLEKTTTQKDDKLKYIQICKLTNYIITLLR